MSRRYRGNEGERGTFAPRKLPCKVTSNVLAFQSKQPLGVVVSQKVGNAPAPVPLHASKTSKPLLAFSSSPRNVKSWKPNQVVRGDGAVADMLVPFLVPPLERIDLFSFPLLVRPPPCHTVCLEPSYIL